MNYLSIVTNRLELIPLSQLEFDYLLNNLDLFEKRLHVLYDGEDFQDELRPIFNKQLNLMMNHPNESIYFTLWVIKRITDKLIIPSGKGTLLTSVAFIIIISPFLSILPYQRTSSPTAKSVQYIHMKGIYYYTFSIFL